MSDRFLFACFPALASPYQALCQGCYLRYLLDPKLLLLPPPSLVLPSVLPPELFLQPLAVLLLPYDGPRPALTQGTAATAAATSANTTLSLAPSRCQHMPKPTPLLVRLQRRRLKLPHQALPHGSRLQRHCWRRVHPATPPDRVLLLLPNPSIPSAQLQTPT